VVVVLEPRRIHKDIDLSWLAQLNTASLVVYLANLVKDTGDLRHVDFSACTDLSTDELPVVADFVRDPYII
jgi:hypothetical protein